MKNVKEKEQRRPDVDGLGVVPIGVPLITGPAVLATCVLLAGLYGRLITAAALVANIAIAGIIFLMAQPITRIRSDPGFVTTRIDTSGEVWVGIAQNGLT